MPVSEQTARRAVTRWGLPGRVRFVSCGCREWWPRQENGTESGDPRRVYVCLTHRTVADRPTYLAVWRAERADA